LAEPPPPLAPAVGLPGAAPRGHGRARDLYLRFLGAVFLCAFASWYAQQDGLIGSGGILPAADYLARLRESEGGRALLAVPTVLWWGASDRALSSVATVGLVSSGLLVLGLLPALALLSCWLCYLSLSVVGGVFMHFQWDALLLEAAVLSLPLCPLALRLSRAAPEPHPIAVLLPRFLLFKLMFLSGWVKLASHDPTWRDGTALAYHYWSQPLPTWTAWIVDGAPRAVHRAATAVTLLVELLAPPFVFAPRRLRLWLAFAPLVALQLLILATGNYGFFNLLTLALCLPLLDDQHLLAAAAALRRRPPAAAPPGRPARGVGAALRSLGAVALALGVLVVAIGQFGVQMLGAELPRWQQAILDGVRPFRSASSYGLFATMTTDRREIAIEGSDDGRAWKAYRFRWKPDEVDRRPGFATPHMPRLDWQMWFAALGDCRRNQWFLLLSQRLLEGKRPVAALFAFDPFPDHPPRYLRSPLYRYRFSDLAGLRKGGAYFTRAPLGEFCPAVTLEGGALRKADLPPS